MAGFRRWPKPFKGDGQHQRQGVSDSHRAAPHSTDRALAVANRAGARQRQHRCLKLGSISAMYGDLRVIAIMASGGSDTLPLATKQNQVPIYWTVQRFGLILAAKDWARIFPFRITKVSVANSYELSAVSAVQTI